MNFIPYQNKIEFSPIKKDSIIQNDKDSIVEVGLVLSVGTDVTFVKPGDTVFFLSYGAEQTPEIEGESHWTVACVPEFIMGKSESHV